MSSVKVYAAALLKEQASENARQNRIHRMFLPAERYEIDFADDFKDDGWEQYDTDQDAHYFGVWVNPKRLMTLSYVEGDWALVVAPDVAAYNLEIQSMNEFYREGFEFKTIDEAGITEYRQDRDRFFIKEVV